MKVVAAQAKSGQNYPAFSCTDFKSRERATARGGPAFAEPAREEEYYAALGTFTINDNG
jgi:hypothetical protein